MQTLIDLYRPLFSVFYSDIAIQAFTVLSFTAPVWLPITLAFLFWSSWIDYIRAKFIHNQKYILLELKLPREVHKSPLAMELALSGLYVTAGETTWYDKYVLGKMRPWFSLEIVSIEGNIHFYIWTRQVYKNVVEAQMYGQYPNIEITEAIDYTATVPRFDYREVSLWGHEYKLDKADPYPIKTYVDYGLDKDPKEEYKIDPLTSVLEYMAGLGKGEQIWLQILVQSHKKKSKGGVFFPQSTDVQKEGKELIKKLLAELKEKTPTADEGVITYSRIPTKTEAEIFAAIDRSISKLNFDCGIRLIYLAKPENFVGTRIPQTIAILRPFSSNHLNSFTWRWGTTFDFPFQDFKNIRANWRRRIVLKAYKLRSWFYPPHKRKPFILSSEELATIYHPVGEVLQAPTVERIPSIKAEAPTNLPR